MDMFRHSYVIFKPELCIFHVLSIIKINQQSRKLACSHFTHIQNAMQYAIDSFPTKFQFSTNKSGTHFPLTKYWPEVR